MNPITFDAIGTKWVIDIYTSDSDKDREYIASAIHREVETFDKEYSRFREDSLIKEMSRKSGEYLLTGKGLEVFSLYEKLYRLTGGAFTPLIASVLEDAGYDAGYSLVAKDLHTPPPWDEVVELTETGIKIKIPALLDLGAAGKGALVDIVAELLEKNGIAKYCIDAGGDIFYKNPENLPMRVGLEHPTYLEQVIGVVTLHSGSIAASAGNRRKWGKYHHLMDPLTLKPVESVLASWVIAETAMLADALATAVFFTSPAVLKEHFTFSYLIVFPDYSINKTSDFPAELYYTNS